MAEEAILKVSLKDYKQQIDELRASLLGLDSASQEYQETAEQVKSMQDKLNEVMNVGKKSVEGVEGSYNALRQQLSELKKEWQTLEIGSDKWNELGAQIDNINDQLKDADASIGIFNRNVGDYANSFEEAGKSLLDNLGQINPVLGQNMNAIKRLVPMIKATTKTATAGLKGIKAAIAGTGIGALIIALGILLNYVTKNWDAIKDWVTGVSKAKKAHDELTKSIEEGNNARKQMIDLMQKTGSNAFEVESVQLQGLQDNYKQLKEEYDEWIAHHRKNSKYAKELLSGVTEAESAVTVQAEAMKTNIEAYARNAEIALQQEGWTDLQKTIYQINREFDAAIANTKELTEDAAEASAMVARLEALRTQTIEKARRDSRKSGGGGKSQAQTELEEIQKRSQEIADSYKTEAQLLTEKYNKEKALYEKHRKDTAALDKKYQEDLAEIAKKEKDAKDAEFERLSGGTALTKSLKDATRELEREKTKLDSDTIEYANMEIKIEEKRVEIAREYLENLEKLSDEDKEHYKEIIEDAKDALSVEEQRLKAQEKSLKLKEQEKRAEAYEKLLENIMKNEGNMFDGMAVNMLNNGMSAGQAFGDGLLNGLKRSGFEGFKERLSALEALQQQVKNDTTLSAEQTAGMLNAIAEAYANTLEAQFTAYIAVFDGFATAIGDIFSSIAGFYEHDIEQQVKHGKMTEKEAEKEYKRVQNMQVAQAVINTLAGALAALTSPLYQSMGAIGMALAVAQAAAVTAAGALEIKKIKSQNPYSNSGDVGNSNFASAVPKLADYSPDTFTNLTSKSDTDYLSKSLENTNLYVSVTDINNVQNKVKVRDGNSTF